MTTKHRTRLIPVQLVTFAALIALGVAACTVEDDDDDFVNDKNTCEQACDKIETCPSQQCTLNFEECDAETEAVAECVLSTPCEQLSTCL